MNNHSSGRRLLTLVYFFLVTLISAVFLGLAPVAGAQLPGVNFGPVVPLNTEGGTDLEIATDREGTWIAVWEADGIEGGFSDVYVSRSFDNGLSWTDRAVVNATAAAHPTAHDSEPHIATDRNGNWVVAWSASGSAFGLPGSAIAVSTSTDAGATWSYPVVLNDASSFFENSGEAHVDTDGTGNWVVVWESAFDIDTEQVEGYKSVYASRSVDNGAHWSEPTHLNRTAGKEGSGDFSPRIATDRQGNWVAVWDTEYTAAGVYEDGVRVLAAHSSDAGQTWSNPVLVSGAVNPDGNENRDASITTDGQGNWLVMWQSEIVPAPGQFSKKVYFSRSSNNGATWDIVDPSIDMRNLVMSADVATDGEGSWIACWYSYEGASDFWDIYYAGSTNNGATWSTPALLSRASSDPNLSREAGPSIAADGNGHWVGVWTTEESGPSADRDLFARPFTLGPVAPVVQSIVPDTAGPTTEDVTFTVTFSEAVQNFNGAPDLVVLHDDTAHGGIAISGGPQIFTVVVQNITGDGELRLRVNTASDVQDLDGEALASSVTSAAVHIDNTGPIADSIVPATTGPTNADTVNFSITFNDSLAPGFGAPSDLIITHSGTAHGGYTVTGGPQVFTASIEGITGTGSFTVQVNPAGGGHDVAGNPVASSVTSAPVLIDNGGPAAISIVPSTTGPTAATSVSFTITFDTDLVPGFGAPGDLVITHSGTASTGYVVTGGPRVFTATVQGISGNGSFTVAVNTAGSGRDALGNPVVSSVTSAAVTIIHLEPRVTLSTTAPSVVSGPIAVTATLTEPSLDFVAGDIALQNATISNFSGSGQAYSFTLSGIADGAFGASVPQGVFTDADGNGNFSTGGIERTFDTTGPVFSALVAQPGIAQVGNVVQISFAANEVLQGIPVVSVNGHAAAFASGSYTYSYTVRADDPFGPATIAISGVDLLGHAGSNSNNTALVIVAPDTEAPQITQHPVARTVNFGVDATFTISAQSNGPISYQWQKGGSSISNGPLYSGATSATLTVLSCANADEGSYRCVATNSAGGRTSNAAALTVNDPVIVTQPADVSTGVGRDVQFTVVVGGTAPITYQWFKKGIAVVNDGRHLGAQGPTLQVLDVVDGTLVTDEGLYHCVIQGMDGPARTTRQAMLTIGDPFITQHPASQFVAVGGTAVFHGEADGTAPIVYGWRRNGLGLSDGGRISGALTNTLSIANVGAGDVGEYSMVAVGRTLVVSNSATLSIGGAPVITQVLVNPPSGVVAFGGTITLSVVATAATQPLTYQWLRGTELISSGPELVISNATAADAGGYRCVVTNSVGEAMTEEIAVRVGLSLVQQPRSQTAAIGEDATFRVVAGGATGNVSYQWFRDDGTKGLTPLADGIDIEGATTAELTLLAVDNADAGDYVVEVSDDLGTVVSGPAHLFIVAALPALSGAAAAALAVALGLGAVSRLRRRRHA